MEKYRVRLKNGRVVGPFLPEQIIEMRQKGYIYGLETCQVFPTGDWLPINQFQFWAKDGGARLNEDGTFVINLGDLKDDLTEDPPPVEDVIQSGPVPMPDADDGRASDEASQAAAVGPLDDLPGNEAPREETGERRKEPRPPQAFREFNYKDAVERGNETEMFELRDFDEDENPSQEKLDERERSLRQESKRVLQLPDEMRSEVEPKSGKATAASGPGKSRDQARKEYDAARREVEEGATRVTPAGKAWQKQLQEEKRQKEESLARLAAEKKAREEAEKLNPVRSDSEFRSEATQVFDLVINTDRTEVRRAEVEILNEEQRQAQAVRDKLAREKQEREAEESRRRAEEEAEERVSKRKRFILLLTIVCIAAIFLLPGGEDKKGQGKPIVPMDPDIRFPLPFNTKDPAKAKALVEEGRKTMAKGTYPDMALAARMFREAYENDVSQKEALAKLVRLFGWLLPHASNFEVDGNTVFKLVRSNKVLLPINPDICLGTALFYRALKKNEAAFSVMDRFVKSQANNPTKELFATYLESLMERNDEQRADSVAASLLKAESKSSDVYLALIHYHRYKNHPEEALELTRLAIEKSPNSVPLLIARGELELEQLNFKALTGTAKKIKELRAENSRVYYGRLLEFNGFILAFQNKTAEATQAFKEAMRFVDSESLQEKLVSIKNINTENNDEATKLIKQIQARELVKESEAAIEKFDFQTGLLAAINAQALNSGYIRADLHLAAVQLRLGMTKDALETLEALQKENAGDQQVNLALLSAYIETYKFSDAKKLFAILAASDMREKWQYSSLNASMYEKMGDLNQSILWLQKSINLNPLNDDDIFKLAKLLIRAKKFDQAKNRLFQAMELDPSRIDYKLAYGSIIYEVEGPDAAIAYLFGLLKNNPENPSILGDIAIYYYRAGKEKQFQDTKTDIEALPVKDPRVNRFLIKSALLNEKWDEAVRQTEELIKLEPGDLAAMMEIAKVLMSLNRNEESAKWLVRVRDKLPSYPKVGYYKASINLKVGEPDQAMKDLTEDLKINGPYEEGLVLKGDIYRSQEKFVEAEAEYKSALKLNIKSPGAMRGLASIALKRGQMDIAQDLFRRALAEDKDNPEIHRMLGDVYRLQGQGSLAIEEYKVYLKLRPEAEDRPQVDQYIRVLE